MARRALWLCLLPVLLQACFVARIGEPAALPWERRPLPEHHGAPP